MIYDAIKKKEGLLVNIHNDVEGGGGRNNKTKKQKNKTRKRMTKNKEKNALFVRKREKKESK